MIGTSFYLKPTFCLTMSNWTEHYSTNKQIVSPAIILMVPLAPLILTLISFPMNSLLSNDNYLS